MRARIGRPLGIGIGALLLGVALTATVLAHKADTSLLRSVFHALRAAATPPPPPAEDAIVTLNPQAVHQTMRGWEVVAQAEQHFSDRFPAYAPHAFDRAVEIGIDRLRLEVRAGSENRTDSWAEWAAAGYPGDGAAYTAWRARRYETLNDNSDPNVIDRRGFHFSEIDDTIDLVVNPMRSRLAERGESLYVNLTYVAFTGQITSGQYLHHAPAEYAEFMLATFQHLQEKYGWVPDAIEVMLEPDNVTQWRSGPLIGQVIVETGRRLAAHGFTPHFVGPSTTCMNNAVSYFDGLIGVADVKTYLTEIAYHRYCGVSGDSLDALAARARMHGLSTSMLEWWSDSNGRQVLHEDLKRGGNSAWEQGVLAGTGGGHVTLLHVDRENNIRLGPLTRYTSQYFQHVRRGATRIDAASSAPALDPLAFVNVNGTYVVVVNALNAGSFSIRGLPEGRYGIRYTTETESTGPAERTIVAGEGLAASIPAAGVLTVYGLSTNAPDPPPASPAPPTSPIPPVDPTPTPPDTPEPDPTPDVPEPMPMRKPKPPPPSPPPPDGDR